MCYLQTIFVELEKQVLLFNLCKFCSEWNARLPVTMQTPIFAKHPMSLILALLLSFLSFKEGRVEAIGEFYFPC